MIALGAAYYFIGTIALFGVPIVVIVAIMIYSLGTAMPSSAIAKRRKNIDTRLPMALAYIATMASADVPVENIMYELGKSPQYGEIAKEARTISASSRLFGNDIVSALREESKYSPSLKFAEFLSGITSTVTSGGNLKDYFTMKAKQFQSELSTLIKQNSESVGVLAESYVTVGVAFPLMMIVILGILAAISSGAGAVITVLYLIVLMMVPMITFVFAFLIQSTIKEVNI
jgi:flagellar protein FlaJ